MLAPLFFSEDDYYAWLDEHDQPVATMDDAHREWHRNTGTPMGTPGCPQDACHDDYDSADDAVPSRRLGAFGAKLGLIYEAGYEIYTWPRASRSELDQSLIELATRVWHARIGLARVERGVTESADSADLRAHRTYWTRRVRVADDALRNTVSRELARRHAAKATFTQQWGDEPPF